jgi:hypothetical protein
MKKGRRDYLWIGVACALVFILILIACMTRADWYTLTWEDPNVHMADG